MEGSVMERGRAFTTLGQAQVGDAHKWSRTFDADDIERTGQATLDRNPVNFDQEYAALTRFKRPILHGVAVLGEVSRALGMDFPGRGTIFVELKAKFQRPVYPGDTVDFTAVILEVEPQRSKLVIEVVARVLDRVVLGCTTQLLLEADHPLPM